METGIGYMTYMAWFYALLGFKMSTDGVLRGSGDMVIFTVANLINLVMRVLLATNLAPVFGVHMVWYVVPIGWAVNVALTLMQYKRGKWKKAMK
jgi:Na+-driven multidrug efflux pump